MYSIKIPIPPVPQARPRFNSKTMCAYTTDKTRRFKTSVWHYVSKDYKAEPMTGPLIVRLVFNFPIKKSYKQNKQVHHTIKPDLDNLQKSVLDSLNQVLWKDDAQIISITALKFYDWTHKTGSIELSVSKAGEL